MMLFEGVSMDPKLMGAGVQRLGRALLEAKERDGQEGNSKRPSSAWRSQLPKCPGVR